MKTNKVVLGVRFNNKSFRLQSIMGALTDDFYIECDENKKLGTGYVTKFSFGTDPAEPFVQFSDDNKCNVISVRTDSFIFSKGSISDSASVNVDNAIEEFELLWKFFNKRLQFPSVRRLGLIAETHIDAKSKDSAPNQLIESLLSINGPKFSGRFNLTWEDREINSSKVIPDYETGDFWNTIYTFYPSEMDRDFPVEGKINANIDVQKYYNPAKSDPIKELRSLRAKFTAKKANFKEQLKQIGLV